MRVALGRKVSAIRPTQQKKRKKGGLQTYGVRLALLTLLITLTPTAAVRSPPAERICIISKNPLLAAMCIGVIPSFYRVVLEKRGVVERRRRWSGARVLLQDDLRNVGRNPSDPWVVDYQQC